MFERISECNDIQQHKKEEEVEKPNIGFFSRLVGIQYNMVFYLNDIQETGGYRMGHKDNHKIKN